MHVDCFRYGNETQIPPVAISDRLHYNCVADVNLLFLKY